MWKCGFSLAQFSPKGTIKDFVSVRENMGQRKYVLWHILHCEYNCSICDASCQEIYLWAYYNSFSGKAISKSTSECKYMDAVMKMNSSSLKSWKDLWKTTFRELLQSLILLNRNYFTFISQAFHHDLKNSFWSTLILTIQNEPSTNFL